MLDLIIIFVLGLPSALVIKVEGDELRNIFDGFLVEILAGRHRVRNSINQVLEPVCILLLGLWQVQRVRVLSLH